MIAHRFPSPSLCRARASPLSFSSSQALRHAITLSCRLTRHERHEDGIHDTIVTRGGMRYRSGEDLVRYGTAVLLHLVCSKYRRTRLDGTSWRLPVSFSDPHHRAPLHSVGTQLGFRSGAHERDPTNGAVAAAAAAGCMSDPPSPSLSRNREKSERAR